MKDSIMIDIQREAPGVPLQVDCVGIHELSLPLVVRAREEKTQNTVATVSMGVELHAGHKGTHMSRFVEVLEGWTERLDSSSAKRLLEDTKQRLEARKAWVRFDFPFFIRKNAPSTNISSSLAYTCALTAELEDGSPAAILLEVQIPVMSVCPCSKAISREGAHTQRATIRLYVRMEHFVWIEELVDIAESAGSSPVYTLLKREDEKYVTEAAFANPMFVEDMARHVAQHLLEHPHISWFKVEVESQESIHGHNAFARIER